MPEQLQRIGNQILEWWKKFNTRQKVLILSIAATIILALVILAAVVGKPTMVTLVECASAAEAGEVKTLLDDENIAYDMSQNGLIFYVNDKDEATASILLGQNDIPTQGFDISKVFEGGFSSTEADKTKRYQLYLEEKFAKHLEALSNVESAWVTLNIPADDGTILARNQESYASVILALSKDMDDDQALGLAQYIATQLGNDSTDNIRILDSNSNVLFSGGDSATSIGAASSQLSLRTKTESLIKGEVKDVLVGSSLFDHVEVGLKLDLNFDQKEEATHERYAPDGQTNGMIGSKSEYESESEGGGAAVPGTDANDDTPTYVTEDGSYSSSRESDVTTNYENNERITKQIAALGTINYDQSSIALVATNYVIYDEDTLKASGALEDMTFDEYIAANSEPTAVQVSDEYYNMVAMATGFPVESISIIAQEEPVFQYSAGGRSLSDYLQIVLAVLIFALLGYVVFRSTRKDKVVEMEPELSVESLLESTKESQESHEGIGYTEKSEVRVLIEKFVEENPEAAASLLRNWLNEDWE